MADKHDLSYLPVDKLVPNSWNAQDQDEATFNRLVDEVTEVGFIDPVEVIPMEDGTYRILGGEHRWMAAKKAGREEVPCIVLRGEKWQNEDLQKFVTVRLNTIRGQLNPEKFLKLYEEMASKYGAEALQQLMGYTDAVKWSKLVQSVSKGMKKALPKGMHKEFDKKAAEAKTVEDLEKIIQDMFSKYGDTLNLGFMIFTYGKQEHLYIAMDSKLKKAMDALRFYCQESSRNINDVMAPLVKHLMQTLDSEFKNGLPEHPENPSFEDEPKPEE